MKNNSIKEIYNIKNKKYIYQLSIDINEKEITFIINLLNNSIDYYFKTKINSIELIQKLGLNINKFYEPDKLINIFNKLYHNNKISINQSDDTINLIIKYNILYEELIYEIKLNKVKMIIEDKFIALYNQIYYLTNKFQDNNIKDINNEINELNISLNEKEKELKNIINEKDNIIKEISNKLYNQEKIIKELNNKDNKIILNKFEEIENNLVNNLNTYKQEINNIKNSLINNINLQLNKQNDIIKEILKKNKKYKINNVIGSSFGESIDIEKINVNNEIKRIELSSISQKTSSKNKSNDKAFLKEILKEMNQNQIKKDNLENSKNEKELNINNMNNNNIKIEHQENENNFIIEENNISEIYTNYNDKINYEFKRNPKYLKYKLDITYTNTNWGANDIFEVFLSYKDNTEYIISPNYINNNLDIYTLKKIKLKRSLKAHKNRITVIRYFINNQNNNYKEYLISADYNKIIFIWDINNNYNILHKINTQYGTTIYSCLLVFPDNEENYIVSSTWNTSEQPIYSATKLYSLENGDFISHISNTNNEKIYYLLSWHNLQNNNYYIVQFAYKKILINNLIKDELYMELIDKNEYYHYSGFIYNKNNVEYLCSSSSNGYINIWNLYNKKIFKCLNTNKCCLFHIIKWSNDYIIVADYNNKSFKVIDVNSGEIIKEFNGYHNDAVKCIKKIYHPLYGESLLTSGEDKTIKLWII